MCRVSVAIVLSVVITIQADDAQDKAKAVLALAKAKRERESSTQAKALGGAGVQEGCFTDLATAQRVASMTGKPLVVWVGMVCTDAKDVCKAIEGDCVSVHVKSYRGSDTARIVFPSPDGFEYRVLKSELNATSPIGIRKRMGLSVSHSPIVDAIVIERDECSNGVCKPKEKP